MGLDMDVAARCALARAVPSGPPTTSYWVDAGASPDAMAACEIARACALRHARSFNRIGGGSRIDSSPVAE
jgi:hypothetical protein